MRTKIVLFQSFPFLGLIFCISYFMISLLPLPLALLHMKGFFGKQCFSSLYLMVLRKWCFISFHVSVINSVYECACVCVYELNHKYLCHCHGCQFLLPALEPSPICVAQRWHNSCAALTSIPMLWDVGEQTKEWSRRGIFAWTKVMRSDSSREMNATTKKCNAKN